MKKNAGYRIEFMYKPGLTLTDVELARLTDELREVALTCFYEVPDYQVLRGSREEFSDKILAIAWRKDGKMAGFCSMILLPVQGIGEILHLGLTCVRPEDRGTKLTHLLTKKIVLTHLLRYAPVTGQWITNCACVLSSLGNVALHFDEVYPTPYEDTKASPMHYKIAETIDKNYRDKIYIRNDSVFDPQKFVFRGSVKDTVFQKEQNDKSYHHRKPELNAYYSNIMEFQNGDEVLQVGKISLFTSLKYLLKRKKVKSRATWLDSDFGGELEAPSYSQQ